jgi:hypothetical protein
VLRYDASIEVNPKGMIMGSRTVVNAKKCPIAIECERVERRKSLSPSRSLMEWRIGY